MNEKMMEEGHEYFANQEEVISNKFMSANGERGQGSFWELNNPFQRERMVGAGTPPPVGKPGNCGFCKTGRGGSFGGGPDKRCGYNYGCIIAGVVLAYFIYKQIKK